VFTACGINTDDVASNPSELIEIVNKIIFVATNRLFIIISMMHGHTNIKDSDSFKVIIALSIGILPTQSLCRFYFVLIIRRIYILENYRKFSFARVMLLCSWTQEPHFVIPFG